ncbi:MAG: hypothetical protein KGJ90_03935 [Patescibacteria group bacterium]|nr:hypothetical protein [Patescibacteria group bacterium]
MSEEVDVLDSLTFPCDPSKLPTSRTIPVGDLILEVKGAKGVKSRATEELSDEDRAKGKKGGKVAIEFQLSVDQPETHRGTLHRHTFWIGSDDDPNGVKAATWLRNGADLMKMLKEAGVGVAGVHRVKEACLAAVGQKVGAHSYLKASKKLDPKTGQPYPSRVEIGSWWRPGTREVRVQEQGIELGDAVVAETQPDWCAFR